MSKKTRDKILSKLQRLDQYLVYLKEISKYRKDLFVSDYRVHGLGERYLQLSIEILLDVGKLLVIEFELARPETNHEIFDLLREAKIINLDLHSRLGGIVGFRNILVHEYEKIDKGIVYKNLKSGLRDLAAFKRAVLRKL